MDDEVHQFASLGPGNQYPWFHMEGVSAEPTFLQHILDRFAREQAFGNNVQLVATVC